ncbi:hypothetical protein H112_00325 [Trichophyton rubrum D6]|uniref:Uncharacterized protein n=4 Tax=Trichophyton TaxID=5550 RepID=A0A178F8V4_TRIRU|nr:uncharacterized protein TERG_08253 [Trichophyton rubrum CBS 118892]EZF27642.1 hypothetical protein H100_00326 [Trichophyton rubrum MR850]EZF46746.1 hypothetical protein H102_00325 [Trichophyton rubrum CBS 100081]EZF57400.1 hypothetical protein H103_00324 [Trichophyton rubrum CBS 288.86]EZF67974.1 hypothetical protein H104_00324 [Trichophyton rubrum CBS 289.86]EZF78597.1 hypothetical protein H105_00320 [Trichophyton soudanense CBS 452.61]EZF89222.1 hypothetical protein H110_00328 [Trichophy
MQFFHKNKSQPTLLNSVESAPHNPSDHSSVSTQNHHPHHNREGSQQHQYQQQHQHQQPQHQQQPYQQHQQQHPANPHPPHTFQPATGSHELPSGTYQLGQHSSAASYTHPAHAGSRSENFSLPLQVSSGSAAAPYPSAAAAAAGDRPTLNLVPSASHQPDHSIDALSAAPSLPSAPHSTEASPLTETQPRKSRRSFFSLHSKDKDKDKSSSQNPAKPGRNVSVRKKISNPIPHPKPYQVGPLPPSDPVPDPEEIDITEKKLPQLPNNSSQPSLPPSIYPARGASRSSSHLDIQPFEPPQIQRVSTEPLGQHEEYYKGRPQQYNQYQVVGASPHQQQQLQQNPQFQIDQPQAQPAVTSTATHRPNQSSDQVSIPPRYSPKQDPYHPPRPPSQQSLGPPSPLHPYYQSPDSNYQKPHYRQSLQPVAGPILSQSVMALERPTGLRQPIDTSQQQQQQQQQTPPQQQQQASGQQQQFPPSMPQGQSFKGNSSQSATPGDREQETPPPPGKAKDDAPELDVNGWIQKYEELQLKYNRVKRYYFDKEAQVQQLQNTVAHQRMSASRTVLDDNEYATRLGRLDGAINNLSFNIRKDWKNIPPWLQGVVNEDAHTVGTKEMTAVGRACLTRWIVDELFDRYFHPGLEPNLSRQLKQIERNVRRMGKFVTEEEQENHLSKVSSWRRTTLDGLGDIFQSKLADEHRTLLTRNLVEKLTASLEMNLKTPPPPGLENGVAMIVELAVGISGNIPLESRDISIEYFLPGATITDSHMKIETTLPPLSNPGIEPRLGSEPSSAATDRVDQSSIKGIEAAISSSEATGGDEKDSNFPTQPQPASQGRKKSVFGSLISKKPHSGPGNSTDSMRPPSGHFREREEAAEAAREKENENRIRFAAFVAVEVRGKGTGNVIVKAPVYPFS